MTKILRRLMLGVFTIGLVFTSEMYADTFEFLTYTPPPNGWTKLMSADGPVYRRASGVGLISFYASYPTTGRAADEFAKTWQARIGSALSLQAPQPKIESDGDHKIAIGAQNVDAQGTMTVVSLVTIVGRGRAISFSAVAAGADVLAEVTAFFDSIKITPGSVTVPGTSAAGTIDIDFDVPKGYTSTRDGNAIVLKPDVINEQTPCIYGISPSRGSSGNLEADARAALLEPLPGWQVKGDRYNAMRGTGGQGWPYFWFRTDVQLPGPSYQYLSAMSMAVSNGPGRVGIVWGFGDPARCMLDDVTFARLLFSLNPRGWTPDGGKALARDLIGTWRNSLSQGMAQYKFTPDKRYEYGIGTVTRMGIFETTSSSASDGRYDLSGSTLLLKPNVRGRASAQYKVRVYDEYVAGRWTRAMSMLSENGAKPLDVQYMKVED